MHNDVIYTLLAQTSIVSGVEVYVPENKKEIVESFNKVGAKFITSHTDKVAFHYRNEGTLHYLKLVGPKAPKGGGFYLSPKLEEAKFVLWMDAFAKGFLGQEIALKLGADIKPPYTMVEKINILEESGGTLEQLNGVFSGLTVVQLAKPGKKKPIGKPSPGGAKPKPKPKLLQTKKSHG